MKNLFHLICFVLGLGVFSSCDWIFDKPEPEEETLTTPTRQGKNNLSFLVDGEVWRPKASWFSDPKLVSNYYYDGSNPFKSEFSIRAERWDSEKDRKSYFSFNLKNIGAPGIYSLAPDSIFSRKGRYSFYEYYDNNGERESGPTQNYYTLHSENNWVEVTKVDTVAKIISGVFQFDAAYEEDSTQIIEIRDGRFDLEFNYNGW